MRFSGSFAVCLPSITSAAVKSFLRLCRPRRRPPRPQPVRPVTKAHAARSSIGTIGLIKAVSTYRSDRKVKLATYASRCIENEILMYLRKIAGRRAEVSFDEPLSSDWDGNELLLSDILGTEPDSVMRPLEDDVDRALLLRALSRLPPRERQIISMRFGIDLPEAMTQKEVADRLGISQSYISRLEKRIIAKMRRDIVSQI